MNKKTWTTRCAGRFMDKAGMDTGAAARAAEECADLEEMTNGNSLDLWLDPVRAADEEMARWTADRLHPTNPEEGVEDGR